MHQNRIFAFTIICTCLLLQGIIGVLPQEKNPFLERETHDQPYASDDIEYKRSFTSQLIIDQEFTQDVGTSPWYTNQTEDVRDMDSNLVSQQANYIIVGEQQTFSETNANFTPAEWTFATHPAYPIFPDSYEINTRGLEAQHYWNEDANQSTSVQMEKEITMPVNMSDYTITNATVSAVFNASVHANDGANNGIDVAGDTAQFGTYDYARFYVIVSDLSGENQFEVASNQTINLGQDSAGVMDNITDSFMNVVTEESLILYLSTVLSADFIHFKIAVGIRIWCEDNFGTDADYWDSLIIRNFSLDFTYEKKIDQGSSVSWSEIGEKIDTGGFINSTTQIDNATLNFDYRIDHEWPATSPNSEIRMYLNGFLIPETVKLTNTTTSTQQLRGSGLELVPSLIEENQDITLSIQVYIADNFLLASNLTLLIDNVSLDVGYTITEVGPPITTDFRTLGSLNREIPWGDTFAITVNYTELISQNIIENAIYEVQWIDDYQVDELGNGLYQIECNTSKTLVNQQYTMTITVQSEGFYLSKSLSLEIDIKRRGTILNVFYDELDITESPVIKTEIMNTLNISTQYIDVGTGESISNATVSLAGSDINSSMYEINETGDYYYLKIDTFLLGLGSHLISVNFASLNYQDGFSQIRIEVTPRETGLQIFLNGFNSTLYPKFDIPIQDTLEITVNYQDQALLQDLSNATVTIEDIEYEWSVTNATHLFLVNTTQFGLGPHYITIVAELENYEQISQSLEIIVNPRETALEVLINGTNLSTFDELTVPITRFINITTYYYDSVLSEAIPSGLITLSGLPEASITTVQKGEKVEFIIDTIEAGLAVYFISIIGSGIDNYYQSVETLQLNVAQILTEITTMDVNQSYLITPGDDFDLSIVINNLDFGGQVSGCEVSYSSVIGSGDLLESEPGVYSAQLPNIPEGIYTIYINVYKEGQLYSFHQYEITLNAISTEIQGLPSWTLYPALGLLGILGISFVAYQQHYKYPLKIRQIRSAKRAIKSGKNLTSDFKTQNDLFSETYQTMLKEETNIRVKKRSTLPSQNMAETLSDNPPVVTRGANEHFTEFE